MKESILKKYFENEISAKLLAEDLKNSQQKTGYDTTSVTIESIENGEFEIQKEHLTKLCIDYLTNQINSLDLNTIGFALMCSDFFHWDSETKSGEIISQVISDWDNENIGYDISRKNVQLWKEYLESGNYCLDKNELKEK
jgi:anti-sigma28 factor (negative regulator of flagellin synthesis)